MISRWGRGRSDDDGIEKEEDSDLTDPLVFNHGSLTVGFINFDAGRGR